MEATLTAALACDTSGNAKKYRNSTWLTALNDSDCSSNDSNLDEEVNESDSSGGSIIDEPRVDYQFVSVTSTKKRLRKRQGVRALARHGSHRGANE